MTETLEGSRTDGLTGKRGKDKTIYTGADKIQV